MAILKRDGNIFCKFRHRFVAWESTIRKLEVDTVLGSFDGYFWQEMCSRCFKIRWTVSEKRPSYKGAGDILGGASYKDYLKRKVEKVLMPLR